MTGLRIMKQSEQVIKAMDDLGGYATFGQLYQSVDVASWKTKTPQATIRRIVQDTNIFFNIRPGLWALKSHKKELPDHIYLQGNAKNKKQEEYGHTYYQGLLLEVGNIKKYETYAPHQDKNKAFLGKTLGDVKTMNDVYPFGYENFVNHVKNVDVSWFNSRKMPECLFEVEHSTSMHNSLIKFNELADFKIRFYIVAHESRKKEFNAKVGLDTFKRLREEVKFCNYTDLSKMHENCFSIEAAARI